MRKLTILILAVLLAVPTGAAFASQEQVIYRQVGAGYFDIWLYSDGVTWQDTNKDGTPDAKGQTGIKHRHEYTIPESSRQGYTLTRVEMTHIFGQAEYNDPGIYSPKAWGRTWNEFSAHELRHLSNNFSVVAANQDLSQGKVTAEWTLDLAPQRSAYDLKKHHTGQGDQFANAVEGWRWYLPVMITWYGIGADIPDFATKLEVDKFADVKPGQRVTSNVTYTLSPDHPQPETAKLRLNHQVGVGEHPVTLVPVNPADAPNAQGVVEFQPGETKEYRYEFTVRDQSRKIISRINPVSTARDSDWSNNRDEALISGDVDIAVRAWPIKNNITISWMSDSVVAGANVRVTRKDNGSPVNVRLTMNGPGGQKVHEFVLGPESAKLEPYLFPVSNAGAYTVTAEAWPVGANDIYPQDNVASTTINVTKQSRPETGPKEPDLRGELGG
ncbi:MAG: hypothetical protein AB1815_14340 [Bacillota bacterium]